MHLNGITNRQASLSLHPEICTILAEACDTAADNLALDHQNDLILLQTLASLFKALTIACEAKWELSPAQQAVLDATEHVLGLQ